MLSEQIDYYSIILILLMINVTFIIYKFVSAYQTNDLQY